MRRNKEIKEIYVTKYVYLGKINKAFIRILKGEKNTIENA